MSDLTIARLSLVEGFNGRPALIAPTEMDTISTLFMTMMSRRESPDAEEIERSREENIACVELAYAESFPRVGTKPFLFNRGLAFIPIRGTLVHRNGNEWNNTRGYDDIRREFDAALADLEVKGIVFDVHSGGGMVYGNFELAEHIRNKRSVKPSLSVVNAGAMSGAYSLGSSAVRMISTPSGDSGSIGVLTMHVDFSKALANFGVNISLIHAGEHKVDGNPFNPLPAKVRADMQARLDGMWQKFISVVSINRGMSEQAVRDTQARVYTADEAVKIGLVDAVMSPQDAVASFRAEVFGSSITVNRSPLMSDTTTPATVAAPAAPATAATAAAAVPATAAVTAAPAAVVAAPATVVVPPAAPAAATAAPDAAQIERTRCQGIIGCEEAKGREALANHFAFKTAMSVDDAKTALAAAPQVQPATAANPFNAAMDATKNPEVANNGGDGAAAADAGKERAGLLDSYVSATGNKAVLKVVK